MIFCSQMQFQEITELAASLHARDLDDRHLGCHIETPEEEEHKEEVEINYGEKKKTTAKLIYPHTNILYTDCT